MAQNIRLVTLFIFIIYFAITTAILLLSISSLLNFLLAAIPSAFLVLTSYWVYVDGRKIDILIQHLGVKEEVTTKLDKSLIDDENKNRILPECCGNCQLYLKPNCPSQYESDAEIWRQQSACKLYTQKMLT